MQKQGKIIVIEGTDGSYKRTQSEKLTQRLNSENILAELISFPTYESPTGKIVGGPYLGKNEICESYFPEGAAKVDPLLASLYYAANRYEESKKMYELIKSGTSLILDRYRQSNKAHQGLKITNKIEREAFFQKLDLLEFIVFGIPKEDFVLFLHMPAEIAYETAVKRAKQENKRLDGHESSFEHLRDSETLYLELAEKYHWPTIECLDFKGNSKTIEQIHDEIYPHIRELF